MPSFREDDAQRPRIRADWTVPVWGVVGMLIQGLAIVWWSATITGDVRRNTGRLGELEGRMTAVELTASTIARLDERSKWIYDEMQRRSSR